MTSSVKNIEVPQSDKVESHKLKENWVKFFGISSDLTYFLKMKISPSFEEQHEVVRKSLFVFIKITITRWS